jgi:hypothetical protein
MWSWRHKVSGPAHQNRLSICFKWNWKRIHSIIEEGAQASRSSTDINNWFCLNSGHPPFLQRLRTHPLALSANIPKTSSSQVPHRSLPTSPSCGKNEVHGMRPLTKWGAVQQHLLQWIEWIWVCLALALALDLCRALEFWGVGPNVKLARPEGQRGSGNIWDGPHWHPPGAGPARSPGGRYAGRHRGTSHRPGAPAGSTNYLEVKSPSVGNFGILPWKLNGTHYKKPLA